MSDKDIREELAALLYNEHIEGPYIDQYEDFITWDGLDEEHKNLFRAEADTILASPLVARIQAEALREAADEFDARLPDGTSNGRAYNSYTVARMLRARADRQENPT